MRLPLHVRNMTHGGQLRIDRVARRRRSGRWNLLHLPLHPDRDADGAPGLGRLDSRVADAAPARHHPAQMTCRPRTPRTLVLPGNLLWCARAATVLSCSRAGVLVRRGAGGAGAARWPHRREFSSRVGTIQLCFVRHGHTVPHRACCPSPSALRTRPGPPSAQPRASSALAAAVTRTRHVTRALAG